MAAVDSRARVLVVEDDVGIADTLAYALSRDGRAVELARSMQAARDARPGFELAILDLGLPDGSGYTLLGEWRAQRSGPAVIVLTGHDEEADCVASLEAGADDFVPKPFSPRALVARSRAVLRRRGRDPGEPAATARAEGADLRLDLSRRTATWRGRALPLTRVELDLLAALARDPGRVYTREQLLAHVWGHGVALTERTVDSHVKALRRKLAEAGAAPTLVASVRGVGFKLREPP